MPIQQIGFQGRPPVFTWATKPAANAVPVGYTITIPEFSHSNWYSNGTYWRPVGGRQVLAMRSNNPVTVQALSGGAPASGGATAETFGPFPGGLVRGGMRLECEMTFQTPGIGTGLRWAQTRINSSSWGYAESSTASGSPNYVGRKNVGLDVVSDTSGEHPRLLGTPYSYDVNMPYGTINVDFSNSWTASIRLGSFAETAVAISSATWAGGIATINTSANHTLAVGDKTVIASVTPSGWNIPDGAIVLSVPTSTQFTVALAANPGTYTSGGTSSRISNMISQSYVLELVG